MCILLGDQLLTISSFQHSKRHCPSHTPYKCSWGKCAYKTTKKKEILKHIENQHATRIPLPCPVLGMQALMLSRFSIQPFSGCNEFIRRHNYLQTHFQTFHQRMIGIPLRRKDLKPSSRMFAPSLPPTLPPLPQIPLPVYLHPPMPVRPSSRPRKSRRPRKPSEDRDPEELQFAPLQPIEYENGLFQDFIVRPRHTAPLLQLAFPQAMLAVLPREETPPPSMGYDVFALKTEDLTTNGVIDDSHPSNSQPPKR